MAVLRKYRFFLLTSMIIAMFGLVLAACSEDSPSQPVKYDGGSKDQGDKQDQNTTPDQKQMWPDVSMPDVWPDPDTGGYGGGSFGCKADSDCFGQKCCPTPWGVKLCAPACTMK